jgi:hypothetical protein
LKEADWGSMRLGKTLALSSWNEWYARNDLAATIVAGRTGITAFEKRKAANIKEMEKQETFEQSQVKFPTGVVPLYWFLFSAHSDTKRLLLKTAAFTTIASIGYLNSFTKVKLCHFCYIIFISSHAKIVNIMSL